MKPALAALLAACALLTTDKSIAAESFENAVAEAADACNVAGASTFQECSSSLGNFPAASSARKALIRAANERSKLMNSCQRQLDECILLADFYFYRGLERAKPVVAQQAK